MTTNPTQPSSEAMAAAMQLYEDNPSFAGEILTAARIIDSMTGLPELKAELEEERAYNKRLHECLTAANFGDVPAGWDAAIDRAEFAEAECAAKDATIKELRDVLSLLLFAVENADETGYVTDLGFINLDALYERAHAAARSQSTAQPADEGKAS